MWPTLLSIAAWSLEGVALWVILRGFGEAPSIALTAFFYATATLAGALVPVPGGLGVTDKLLEEQMARLGGVSPVAATGAMLLVRFATLWFAVAVGFVALALLRAKYPGLMATGDAAVKDPAKAARRHPLSTIRCQKGRLVRGVMYCADTKPGANPDERFHRPAARRVLDPSCLDMAKIERGVPLVERIIAHLSGTGPALGRARGPARPSPRPVSSARAPLRSTRSSRS